VTTGLIDKVIKSEADKNLDHDSDHLPISTTLDLTVQRLEKRPRKDWKRLDGKSYMKTLGHSLPPLRRPLTEAALDAYTGEVTAAIRNAIYKAVPETRPSPHTREGWTEECKAVSAAHLNRWRFLLVEDDMILNDCYWKRTASIQ
jgi:hypothetical protein